MLADTAATNASHRYIGHFHRNAAGLYTVQASAPSITGVANFALTNTPGPPAKSFRTRFPRAQRSDTIPSQLSSEVTDAGGNLPERSDCNLHAPASGASALVRGGSTPELQIVPASHFSTPHREQHHRMYAVMASVAGVSTPAALSLSNTATQATTITATSGTPQTTPILTPFASPLVASVKEEPETPVGGAIVWFSVPLQSYATFSSGPDSYTYLFAATTNGAGMPRPDAPCEQTRRQLCGSRGHSGQQAYATFFDDEYPRPASDDYYLFPPPARRKRGRWHNVRLSDLRYSD